MTKKTYYVATAKAKDGPLRTFLVLPDLSLLEDERTGDEIGRAAFDKEGKDGVVEVSVSYAPGSHLPSCDKTVERVRSTATNMLRRDGPIASPWDVEFELSHRIVVYGA